MLTGVFDGFVTRSLLGVFGCLRFGLTCLCECY